MQSPVQITFRNMESSFSLEEQARQRAGELERHFHRITSCHVTVEAPHRSQRHGRHFHVRIELAVPGAQIVVNRHPAEHDSHEDAHVAMRDAFDAAHRQLATKLAKARGDGRTAAAAD